MLRDLLSPGFNSRSKSFFNQSFELLDLGIGHSLGEATPLYLVCAHRAQLSKPVHLLRDFVQARCAVLLAQAPWAN